MSYQIDDFHQAVLLENQKVIFNLSGVDPNMSGNFKSIFKTRTELIESIKILQQKCENDGLIHEKKIDQEMRFYKHESGKSLYCKTLYFNNGRQKSQTTSIFNLVSTLQSGDLTPGSNIPYEVKLSELNSSNDISVNDCIAMVTELKLNMVIDCWVLSIVLLKTWFLSSDNSYKILDIPEKTGSKKLNIYKLKEIKSKMLNSEFTPDNFINTAPYEYADLIKIQLEFTPTTYFALTHIHKAVKLLENSLIDTCRITPQDIYIKISTILKLTNLAKYQSGEFGIKQLTSRVITLDHDILHKELIPAFSNYAVSEKTDGITSVVLITGNDIYITCGSIVYRFDVIKFPSLPPSKNIEALGLNKMDFNNVWIFDAEVIISNDNNMVIIPFDIRMASSINVDNINFKYRLMFMNGLAELTANKITIKLKRWYNSSDIKALYNKTKSHSDGYIFAYLEQLNFTISMYYANKIWKWKPSNTTESADNNTIDFLIQKCPPTLKGKLPYIAGDKNLYVLCCGLSKAVHQALPNITVIQSLIPNNANEYIPALFSPSDKPYSHLFWTTSTTLHGEIGEFIYNRVKSEWSLIKIRNDRRIEVERGNYFGNDHRTAENNWFMMNHPLLINAIDPKHTYVNPLLAKTKFITSIYDNLIKHVLLNNETIINICPITIMDCFNKFISVIYVFNNTIEANKYIKDKYELAKKKIRFNSYYALCKNITNIKDALTGASIPMSINGVDNLLLIYSINKNDGTPGFSQLFNGLHTVKLYENLINKNGKIIIVINEHESNYSIKEINDAFTSSRFYKILDTPVSKWVYITDTEYYETSRILIYTKVKPVDL